MLLKPFKGWALWKVKSLCRKISARWVALRSNSYFKYDPIQRLSIHDDAGAIWPVFRRAGQRPDARIGILSDDTMGYKRAIACQSDRTLFNAYQFMTTLEQSGRFSVEQVKDLTRALESSQTTQWVTNEQLRASLAEIRAEIADFKAEVKTEIAQVRTEIAVAVNKIVLWVVGIDLAFFTGKFGLLDKALHWY